jgi:hypothetical protein
MFVDATSKPCSHPARHRSDSVFNRAHRRIQHVHWWLGRSCVVAKPRVEISHRLSEFRAVASSPSRLRDEACVEQLGVREERDVVQHFQVPALQARLELEKRRPRAQSVVLFDRCSSPEAKSFALVRFLSRHASLDSGDTTAKSLRESSRHPNGRVDESGNCNNRARIAC